MVVAAFAYIPVTEATPNDYLNQSQSHFTVHLAVIRYFPKGKRNMRLAFSIQLTGPGFVYKMATGVWNEDVNFQIWDANDNSISCIVN